MGSFLEFVSKRVVSEDLPRGIPPAYQLRRCVPEWLTSQPTLFVTLIYAALTVAGATHAWLYYRGLGLNFLVLADITDLFVMIFREPLLALLLVLPLPVYQLYLESFYWCLRWIAGRNGLAERYLRKSHVPPKHPLAPWIILLFLIVYAFVFITFYTNSRLREVRGGEAKTVTVRLNQNAAEVGQSTEFEAILAGTTVRFVILYDPETRRSRALPHDAIAEIVFPPRTPSKDEEADGAEDAESENADDSTKAAGGA